MVFRLILISSVYNSDHYSIFIVHLTFSFIEEHFPFLLDALINIFEQGFDQVLQVQRSALTGDLGPTVGTGESSRPTFYLPLVDAVLAVHVATVQRLRLKKGEHFISSEYLNKEQ